MDDLYADWIDIDSHFVFAFVVNARQKKHTAHIVERATDKALCGQNNVANGIQLIARKRSPRLTCKRCQESYWKRYEEAMKDL